MACDDYGEAEELEMKTALVTHLGNYIGDTDAIEETTCDDNDARRHLLLSTVTIGFTVAESFTEFDIFIENLMRRRMLWRTKL